MVGFCESQLRSSYSGAAVAELLDEHKMREFAVFSNRQEIITLMTTGDHPDLLAAGYLLNQGMRRPGSDIAGIEHDPKTGNGCCQNLHAG